MKSYLGHPKKWESYDHPLPFHIFFGLGPEHKWRPIDHKCSLTFPFSSYTSKQLAWPTMATYTWIVWGVKRSTQATEMDLVLFRGNIPGSRMHIQKQGVHTLFVLWTPCSMGRVTAAAGMACMWSAAWDWLWWLHLGMQITAGEILWSMAFLSFCSFCLMPGIIMAHHWFKQEEAKHLSKDDDILGGDQLQRA